MIRPSTATYQFFPFLDIDALTEDILFLHHSTTGAVYKAIFLLILTSPIQSYVANPNDSVIRCSAYSSLTNQKSFGLLSIVSFYTLTI